MLSRITADAAASLRCMGAGLRRSAEAAGVALVRVDDAIAGITRSWSGPAPTEFAGHAVLAAGSVAMWPRSLDAAAGTIERWAIHADNLAADARRAESGLARAFDADLADRDVLVRAARWTITEIEQHWATVCRLHREQLIGSMNTLATIADRSWGIGDSSGRAVAIAAAVATLDMDLDIVDSTGTVQSSITAMLDDFLDSSAAEVVISVLETARDRDLFAADGHLSDDDLAAAVDPTWAREAVRVWQQATGIGLDDDVAVAIAEIVPAVARLMQADRRRDWNDGSFEIEPALRAVLADAAVASLARSPDVLADHYDLTADAVDAFTRTGSGDIDALPEHPTSSEWSYHLHGPPSIDEAWETSSIFRTLLFDWEKLWGEDRSWGGAAAELIMVVPVTKGAKLTKAQCR